MKIRLTDIIDLDVLICADNDLETREKMDLRTQKDREIYLQMKSTDLSEIELIWSWYDIRKKQYEQEADKTGRPPLPGAFFSSAYRWMIYAMGALGICSGFSLAGTFLVYHGNRPVNITVFFVLFVMLPLIFTIASVLLGGIRFSKRKEQRREPGRSFIHTLLNTLMFNLLPKIMKKTGLSPSGKPVEWMEDAAWNTRMRTDTYHPLFFWPFFILTSVCAAGFSLGSLGVTFFRVLVSDMAFGWQSTLITSSETVYGIVSAIALPWRFFMADAVAFPGMAQIEGSRLVLKEGISVLATRDLVSWWPFLCMGILVYALIPRIITIFWAVQAQQKAIRQFEFLQPEYRQLILRMTSPLLDIETPEKSAEPLTEAGLKIQKPDHAPARPDHAPPPGMILASDRVYSAGGLETVKETLGRRYGVVTDRILFLNLNAPDVEEQCNQLDFSGVDPVVLVQEAWQPPIRGLLHSISELKKQIPAKVSLWILLTDDAGGDDLSVNGENEYVGVWQRAVQTLDNPMIIVKRMMEP